jgi:hypothetical protein
MALSGVKEGMLGGSCICRQMAGRTTTELVLVAVEMGLTLDQQIEHYFQFRRFKGCEVRPVGPAPLDEN